MARCFPCICLFTTHWSYGLFVNPQLTSVLDNICQKQVLLVVSCILPFLILCITLVSPFCHARCISCISLDQVSPHVQQVCIALSYVHTNACQHVEMPQGCLLLPHISPPWHRCSMTSSLLPVMPLVNLRPLFQCIAIAVCRLHILSH